MESVRMEQTRSMLLVLAISASLLSFSHVQQTSAATSADACRAMLEAVESTTPQPVGLTASGVSPNAIIYNDGLDTITTVITNRSTNYIFYNAPQIAAAMNVAGYICCGAYSALGGLYPTDGNIKWSGHSRWWIIETVESFNGTRGGYGQGNFIQWFSSNAFGGTNYSNTPIGAVSHTEEPELLGIENSPAYFGLWAAGKNFAICAWTSRNTPFFQAVVDPFVTR